MNRSIAKKAENLKLNEFISETFIKEVMKEEDFNHRSLRTSVNRIKDFCERCCIALDIEFETATVDSFPFSELKWGCMRAELKTEYFILVLEGDKTTRFFRQFLHKFGFCEKDDRLSAGAEDLIKLVK